MFKPLNLECNIIHVNVDQGVTYLNCDMCFICNARLSVLIVINAIIIIKNTLYEV